jgi:hypothetical protein
MDHSRNAAKNTGVERELEMENSPDAAKNFFAIR